MENLTENTKKDEISTENLSFDEKKANFAKELEDLLKKYQFNLKIRLEFPDYKVLPDDVKLALATIARHKNQFVIDFIGGKDGITN